MEGQGSQSSIAEQGCGCVARAHLVLRGTVGLLVHADRKVGRGRGRDEGRKQRQAIRVGVELKRHVGVGPEVGLVGALGHLEPAGADVDDAGVEEREPDLLLDLLDVNKVGFLDEVLAQKVVGLGPPALALEGVPEVVRADGGEQVGPEARRRPAVLDFVGPGLLVHRRDERLLVANDGGQREGRVEAAIEGAIEDELGDLDVNRQLLEDPAERGELLVVVKGANLPEALDRILDRLPRGRLDAAAQDVLDVHAGKVEGLSEKRSQEGGQSRPAPTCSAATAVPTLMCMITFDRSERFISTSAYGASAASRAREMTP